jgi:hypothetical protein
MYCPRCGSPNTETTKYCRQCGLPLLQVSNYVATGGTGQLYQPPSNAQSPPELQETAEMITLRQKKVLTILGICLAPIVFAIIGDGVLGLGEVVGVPFVMLPFGIVWAVYHFKAQLRRLQEQQMKEYLAQQQMPPQPVFQPQAQQPALSPPPTNPLNAAGSARGSVTEEETRRLQDQQS